MKKNLIYIVLVPLILQAGTITKTLTFSQDQLYFSQVNGFDVLQLAKFGSTQEIGKPLLPEAVFNVLVPATATVTNIEVISSDKLELSGQYKIHPAQPPRPISTKIVVPFVDPDKVAYQSSNSYPSQLIGSNYTGTKSGYRICGFAVYPIQYVPSTGKLFLHTKMVLRIIYEEKKVNETRLSASQKELFSKDIRTLVINPEDIENFSPILRVSDNPDLDYVIITGNSFVSNFQPLADWRTKKGFKAEVKSVDWITANYSGRDTQEKIRNFIIDYFTNHGLKYVLLAGDNAIVPGRRARAVVNTSTGNIPSDLYYSDLQWSWDGNNNNIFGEAGSDTVDFFADVYVGRVSVDNTNQVTTFINKINTYEKNPNTTYLKKALFPSIMLWSSSGYHGRVVNQIIAGITPPDWQDDSIISPSNTQPMFNAINNGYHFAHTAAHGDQVGFYTEYGQPIYTTTTASAQSNGDKLLIMNSIACISGNFEYSDCLAEACMNNANGGTVAAIMNSREGWGTPPQIGPSENLDIEFYDFFFNYDSIEIGMAHARSKDYFAYQAQYFGVWRWCIFELNLFGDPEMPMWSDVPQTMTVSNPDTITTSNRNLQVTVTTSGSPAANVLVCAYKPGEVFAKGYTNGSGQIDLAINALTSGTMYLTVTGKNRLPVEKTIVVLSLPGLVIADHDTGYCKLSVTCLGSIGYDEPGSEQGSGFCYPKSSASQLYFSSMMAGNATDYVIDRFYSVPASEINADWQAVDSLRYTIPAFNGDQELSTSFIDSGHSTPKGLMVYQKSYASANSNYDDFVVLVYKYKNTGATAIDGLYSGIISDFNIPTTADDDIAGTDLQKHAAYMRNGSSQNPTVGIKLLSPTTSANLTVVDHELYVNPPSQMTKETKYQLLNGQISQSSSNRNYNWSVVVSAGPFNLEQDAEQVVAYAMIGGSSEAEFLTNCDNAQDWFDNYYGIVEDKVQSSKINLAGISIHPNPFARSLKISYDLPRTGLLKIAAYDVSGRQIATIINQEFLTTKGNTTWEPKNLTSGIYILRIETPDRSVRQKVMHLR